jgi:hypothetical protein
VTTPALSIVSSFFARYGNNHDITLVIAAAAVRRRRTRPDERGPSGNPSFAVQNPDKMR